MNSTSPKTDSSLPVLEKVTPMMAQYLEIKANYQDCLLFYRMGDFYELFFKDAEQAAQALGIVLTRRGKHQGDDIPMCGVPVERADDYLQRLIALGFRVAVCEQTEDPAEAKKRGPKSVVRREVIRLVTPGTITEDGLLEPGRPNAFLALARSRQSENEWNYGLALIDISTGRFLVCETGENGLASALSRLDPNEIVTTDHIHEDPSLKDFWTETKLSVTAVPRDGLDLASSERKIKDYFQIADLDAFGSFQRSEIIAAGTALNYIEKTQIGQKPLLSPPQKEIQNAALAMDASTRSNLELMRTLSGEKTGSLLWAIDQTVTPGGARLLAERLSSPLTQPEIIQRRLSSVLCFVSDAVLLEKMREILKTIPDLSRALSRLGLGRSGPRDLAALAQGLFSIRQVEELLKKHHDTLPYELFEAYRSLKEVDTSLADHLHSALSDALPLNKRDGGFIREGFLAELDEIRILQKDSRQYIAGLQNRYAQETEQKNLKIKHNHMLGYYVEVSQSAGEELLKDPWRETFVHRQTMAGTMRFSTVELGELEARIASSADRALKLELALFDELSALILTHHSILSQAADALSVIDVSSGLAYLARDLNWNCPKIDLSLNFKIKGGRHPVVEQALKSKGQPFIANDCSLSGDTAGTIVLITGPNMGGKSTYLRQNALIALLAQMGSFVPAEEADIGIVDRLFSRVGAADDLARGRSTFMVEMVETAAILNQATERSLVILDEIGRGTATFDGLSIAWASVEHLHDVNRCRSLFATHFHELTILSERLPRLQNATLKVTEWKNEVIFLHEVIAGAADRSYGLQVARLAGLPVLVLDRAKTILDELEKTDRETPKTALIDDLPLFALTRTPTSTPQQTGFAEEAPKNNLLQQAIDALQPDDLSPKEALEALYSLKREFGQ